MDSPATIINTIMSYKVLFSSKAPAQQGQLLCSTKALKQHLDEGATPVETTVQLH